MNGLIHAALFAEVRINIGIGSCLNCGRNLLACNKNLPMFTFAQYFSKHWRSRKWIMVFLLYLRSVSLHKVIWIPYRNQLLSSWCSSGSLATFTIVDVSCVDLAAYQYAQMQRTSSFIVAHHEQRTQTEGQLNIRLSFSRVHTFTARQMQKKPLLQQSRETYRLSSQYMADCLT